MEKLYRFKEAAEVLRVNPQTIQRWSRQGQLKTLHSGSLLVFTEKSPREFLEYAEAGRGSIPQP